MKTNPLIIGGVRTPFARSSNKFGSLLAHDLGRYVVNGLMEHSNLDPKAIEHLCLGQVIQNPDTSNLAREVALLSRLNKNTPAHTVTMACISSNMSATTVANLVSLGQIDGGIAGGVETFSDLPIRYSRPLRKMMINMNKKKGMLKKLSYLKKFRLKHLKPEPISPKEFTTGYTMGEAGDQIAAAFNISRHDADEYALLSHQRAGSAWRSGVYDDQVITVKELGKDDGPRPDSSMAKLKKLSPSFNKLGINTAGNSSFFTDGASAILLGTQEYCKKHTLKPLASIKDYIYEAGDPKDELLLGPALSLPLLLKRNNLKVSDIGVFEIHEAFAGQVLANLKAIASKKFLKERLQINEALGEIPLEKVNRWGGSLSLGHPFGATGTRLLLTAAKRLIHEDKELAIVSSCAAGGLGSSILLKRV